MQSGNVKQEAFSKDNVASDGYKQGNGILHHGAARGITESYPYLHSVRASLLAKNHHFVRANLLVKNLHSVRANLYAENQHSVRASLVAKIHHLVRASLLANNKSAHGISRKGINWNNLVIAGSPLAAKFTEIYSRLVQWRNKKATRKLNEKRHSSHYDNAIIIGPDAQHLATNTHVIKTKRPAIAITASGMCNVDRMMTSLKAILIGPLH